MDNLSLIQNILIVVTSGTIPLLAIIIFLFMNPAKFDKWTRIFYFFLYNLFSLLPKIKRNIDKRLVAASIQDTVNEISNQINTESPEALPHLLKIEWVRSDTPESFISKNIAIVRLKHYNNQEKNIVDSTLLYLKKGLLPRARNYLDQTLRLSCAYKIASRIFVSRLDTGAYDYFVDNELKPAIKSNNILRIDLQTLENLDSVGFFTRVFLTEVTVTGKKLLGLVPTISIRNELRDFAQFLEVIATKGRDEDVPLQFRGAKVNAAVILVARPETIRTYGIEPYINRVQRSLQEGIDSIYLAAWGDEFVKAVIQIKRRIERNLVTILRRYNYSMSGRTKAILLLCQPKASFLAQQKRLHDEVTNALTDIVPEIRQGTVKIMAIARTENIGFKVAITSAKTDITNPKDCCITRLMQIKERFPNEFVGIVLWSEDIKEFVINSLVPLNPKYVDKVEFDDENLIINIQVLTQEAAGKAIGKNGNNVKLAMELTGWLINIKQTTGQDIVVSPEEELLEILKSEIPEVKNSEIKVVKITRLKGVGSKVIVQWKSQKTSSSFKASEKCYGENHDNLKRVLNKINDEWLNFHDWFQEPENQIAVCLYPLRRQDIKSIEIDDSSKLAVVTLSKQVDHLETNEFQYNIALCAQITGYQIEILVES